MSLGGKSRFGLLACLVLALLSATEARKLAPDHVADRSMRDSPSRIANFGRQVAKAGVHARVVDQQRRGLFEPPRSRDSEEGDVNDHEAADLCGSFAAGACSCM